MQESGRRPDHERDAEVGPARPLTDEELLRLSRVGAGDTISSHHDRTDAELKSWKETLHDLPSRSSVLFGKKATDSEEPGASLRDKTSVAEAPTEAMEAMTGAQTMGVTMREIPVEEFPPTLESPAIEEDAEPGDAPPPIMGTPDPPAGTTSRRSLGELQRRTVRSLAELADPAEAPTVRQDIVDDDDPSASSNAPRGLPAATPTALRRTLLSTDADFVLERMIGKGGQGEVWIAWQASLQRQVAVKCLRSGDIGEFLQEAYTSGELDHPNIVPVYDLGRIVAEGKEQPLLAMKRVRGHPWSALLERDRLDGDLNLEGFLMRHLRIFVDVCNAIAYAHSKGIIHRDLKPSQVMVGEFGEVFLMDWGLAVSTRDDVPVITHNRLPKHSTLRTASNRCGSPAYMAPEQTLESTTSLGFHTDVYLLGAMLFEVVSGQPPHAAETAEGAYYMAVLNEVGELPESTPAELRKLADRSLQTDPARRPASATDFRNALEDFMSGAGRQRESREIVVEVLRAFAETPLDGMNYAQITQCSQRLARALQLWPENADAGELRQRVVQAHARMALEGGDLRLAEVLLDSFDDPAKREALRIGIERERARIEEHQRQRRFLFIACLALSFLSIVGVSLYIIREVNVQKRAMEEAQGRASDQLRLDLWLGRNKEVEFKLAENRELYERVLDLQTKEGDLARDFEISLPLPAELLPAADAAGAVDGDREFEVSALLARRADLAKKRDALKEEGVDLPVEPFELLMGEANYLLETTTEIDVLRRAYEIYMRANRQYPSFPDPLVGMGLAAARRRDFPEAARRLREACEIARVTYGDDDVAYARMLALEAEAVSRVDPADARIEALRRQALDVLMPRWADLSKLIAEQHETLGAHEEAEAFRRVLDTVEGADP